MRKHALLFFGIFLISLAFFAFLQSAPSFLDPDSFYHAKIALLTREGPVRDFPWLPFTTMEEHFADHHYLYHVLLIPFVSFLDPLIGIKVATAFFAALFITLFGVFVWRLTKTHTIPLPLYALAPMLLLTSEPFLTRVNLAKIPALALVWILGILYAFVFQKPSLLFFLSFFYVWLHGGWPLVLILGALAWLAHEKNGKGEKGWKRNSLFFIPLAGTCAGLVVNPFFPHNLFFYWTQIYTVVLATPPTQFLIGAEWSPFWLADLIPRTALPFALFLTASALCFVQPLQLMVFGKERTHSFSERFLFLVVCLFFLLTLRSKRHIEYLVPALTLFSCAILLPAWERLRYLIARCWKTWRRRAFFTIAAALGIATIFFHLAIVTATYTRNKGGELLASRDAMRFVRENTEKNTIIFHDRWDSFPSFFYYNSDNRYILGLDPRFLSEKNPALYAEYVQLTDGSIKRSIAHRIEKNFGSAVVVLSKKNTALIALYDKDPLLSKKYEDEFFKIYRKTDSRSSRE